MGAIIEQAFDGRLAGGYVLKKMPALYRKHRPANWKYTGLRDRIASTGQPWIWVDDEATEMARLDGVFDDGDIIAGIPGLPVVTDEHYGLTLEQISGMDAWLSVLRASRFEYAAQNGK